jgi:hypothetical protein
MRDEGLDIHMKARVSPFRIATIAALGLLLAVVAGCGSYVHVQPGGNGAASSTGTILISVLLLTIFVACVGFLYTERMWSNALRLINVITAALLAMNYFEPLARFLSDRASSYTPMWDFLMLWGLFVLCFVILRAVTDLVSRVDVRFLNIVDRSGSIFLAAWTGWVIVCFTLASLHLAPLGKNFLFGGFQPGSSMFFGVLAPDDEWLGFTQRMSRGAFCCSTGPFDRDGAFYDKQSRRRAELEAYMNRSGRLRINREALMAPPPAPPKPVVPRRPPPKPAPKQIAPKDPGIKK